MPVRKLKTAAKKLARKVTGSSRKDATPSARSTTSSRSSRRPGDVLGVSAARVPKDVPRATQDTGGRPRGIELPRPRRQSGRLRPARVKG